MARSVKAVALKAQRVQVFPAPSVGDLVWCRFPEHAALHPRPASRPALVVAVNDGVVPRRVRVVFGTSRQTQENKGARLVVHQRDADVLGSAGLSFSTAFDMRRSAWLPYTSMWFDYAPQVTGGPAATPRMGQLHPMTMSDLARVVAEP